MKQSKPVIALFVTLTLSLGCATHSVKAQSQTQPEATQQTDDVVRIKTELVQTDVMVFDRRGRFVDGLRPEQFNLTLDGEKRPISLITQVASGSKSEAAQLTARGRALSSTSNKVAASR